MSIGIHPITQQTFEIMKRKKDRFENYSITQEICNPNVESNIIDSITKKRQVGGVLKKLQSINKKTKRLNEQENRFIQSLRQILCTNTDTIMNKNYIDNDIYVCATNNILKRYRVGENDNQCTISRERKKKHIRNVNYPVNISLPINHDSNDVYVYNKVLYMHKMNPNVVHRLENATNSDKEDFRHCLSEVYQIIEAVYMEVTSRLFYCWKGFEENPHGMICFDEIERIKNALYSAGNGMEGAVIHELNHKNKEIHDNVRPYYPGCNEITEMEDLAISHQDWLNFVIKHGSANESRD